MSRSAQNSSYRLRRCRAVTTSLRLVRRSRCSRNFFDTPSTVIAGPPFARALTAPRSRPARPCGSRSSRAPARRRTPRRGSRAGRPRATAGRTALPGPVGDEGDRVDDRAGVEQQVERDADQVVHIPEPGVEDRQHQPDAQAERGQQHQQHRQQHDRPGDVADREEDREQQGQLDAGLGDHRDRAAGDRDVRREVDLAQQRPGADQRGHAAGGDGEEEVPHHQRGEQVDRERVQPAVAGDRRPEPDEEAEHERVDAECGQRVEQRPGPAEGAAAVLALQLALREVPDEPAVLPQLRSSVGHRRCASLLCRAAPGGGRRRIRRAYLTHSVIKGSAVRIALDATPLLGVRTGVGRYVEHLLGALAGSGGDELVATAFTLRGARGLPAVVPAGVAVRHRLVPARALRALWARTELPPAEWLAGRADVVHGTNFVLPPVRHAAGVLTVHDLSYLRTPETVSAASLRYRELVPRSLRRAAVVCTPSAAVADEVRAEYRLPPDRVVVTPLGVDESWLAAEPPPAGWLADRGLPERYLLFVGSLGPRKGLPALLAGYRELRAADSGVPPLVLAGPPGEGPALRAVVAGAACLAFPSVYEGFGLPPLEALACGTPVVASDLPVTREVLDGQAALVPAGDAAALAAALAGALAGDGGPAARAARRAHAAAFTWTRCAEATRAAYRAAVTAGGRARRRSPRAAR